MSEEDFPFRVGRRVIEAADALADETALGHTVIFSVFYRGTWWDVSISELFAKKRLDHVN